MSLLPSPLTVTVVPDSRLSMLILSARSPALTTIECTPASVKRSVVPLTPTTSCPLALPMEIESGDDPFNPADGDRAGDRVVDRVHRVERRRRLDGIAVDLREQLHVEIGDEESLVVEQHAPCSPSGRSDASASRRRSSRALRGLPTNGRHRNW